ncbi:DUF6876 family protein [Methylovulum psychrotolerans]|nr:DUF6876 family protein [Methylovulum psychrotolerans]
MQTKYTAETLKLALDQYIGTENWYHHSLLKKFLYTDGAQFFFQETESYWLLDLITFEYFPLLQHEPFLSIVVESESQQCKICVDDGNGNVLATKHISFSTLISGIWKFYLIDNVLMLPTEY